MCDCSPQCLQIIAVGVACLTGDLVLVAIAMVFVRLGWNLMLNILLWQRYGVVLVPRFVLPARFKNR